MKALLCLYYLTPTLSKGEGAGTRYCKDLYRIIYFLTGQKCLFINFLFSLLNRDDYSTPSLIFEPA